MLSNGNAVSTAVEGGTTVAIIAFFHDSMIQTLPWLALCAPLILLDLMYGIRAAKFRKDKVRISTAVRRSVDKLMSYVMWVAAAVMLSNLFEAAWLDKAVLALVYGNEIISIIGNYLETKGINLSAANLWKLIAMKGGAKVGVELTKEELDEVITEKKPKRDSKGRFTK